MMRLITITKGFGHVDVMADVFGDWAVHENGSEDFGTFSITYIPSGRRIDDLAAWAVDDKDAAIAIAKALDARLPTIPAHVWAASRVPGSQSMDWACIVESVVAETLARRTA